MRPSYTLPSSEAPSSRLRPGRCLSLARLIVSADAVNANDGLPTVYAMHLVDSAPGSLLTVRVGEFGWAFAMEIDRLPRRLVEHLGRATPEEREQVDNAIRAVFEV